jgi:hypothetical protein
MITAAHKNHVNDANTKALWKLNEGSGDRPEDSSANNNDLTRRNQTLWRPGVTTNNVLKGRRGRRGSKLRGHRDDATSANPTGSDSSITQKTGELWTEAYSYDRFGNMTWGASTPAKPAMVISGSRNRITSVDGNSTAVQYDLAGNVSQQLVGASTHQYSYTAENRMWKAQVVGGQTSKYVYDGEGRRVKKIVGSTVTSFIYGAGGHSGIRRHDSKERVPLRSERAARRDRQPARNGSGQIPDA